MYYKIIDENNCGPYSCFDFTPWLPDGKHAGDWLPEVAELAICKSGYHVTTAEHLIDWLGAAIYEVEINGDLLQVENKIACQAMRFVRRVDGWNNKTARLFAVWCGREALKLIDNPDPRSVAACDVAERFANGEATDDELAAASAAAWSAARAAASAAAWSAAWSAARAAAWAAARSAAWAAARDAARDAAWSAARSAAWSAARDAASAADRSAAWAADRSAARDADRSAARSAQNIKLLEMIGVPSPTTDVTQE